MMKLRDALFCPELAGIFGLCEAREQTGRQLAPTNDLRFAGVVAVNGPVLYGKMAKGTRGDRTARGCESSNCRRGCPGGHLGPRRRRAARLDAKVLGEAPVCRAIFVPGERDRSRLRSRSRLAKRSGWGRKHFFRRRRGTSDQTITPGDERGIITFRENGAMNILPASAWKFAGGCGEQ